MNLFKAIPASLKPSFYKAAVFEPVGRAVKYIFLLALLASLALSIIYVYQGRKFLTSFLVNNEAEIKARLSEVVVPLTIKDGEVTAEVKQPYIKTFGEQEEPDFAFIIDTTGKITDLTEYKNGVLIARDYVVVANKDEAVTETKRYELEGIDYLAIRPAEKPKELMIISTEDEEYRLTQKMVLAFIKKFSIIAWPFLLIAVYLKQALGKFLLAGIFLLFSLILNATSRVKLTGGQLYALCLYALTPAVILSVLVQLVGGGVPFFGLIYIILYLVYISLGHTYAKEALLPESMNEPTKP